MEWQAYLAELRENLMNRGMEELVADRYVRKFYRFFETLSAEDVADKIQELGSVAELTENLLAMDCAKTRSSMAEKKQSNDENAPQQQTIRAASVHSEESAASESSAADAETSSPESDGEEWMAPVTQETTLGREDPEEIRVYDGREVMDPMDPALQPEVAIPILPGDGEDSEAGSQGSFFLRLRQRIQMLFSPPEENRDGTPSRLPQFLQNGVLFWVLLVLTLPITLTLLVGLLLLFIFIVAGLAFSVFLLLVGLAGVVFGGTGISLAGMMLGVTFLLRELSVGLYEIGIGICVGGTTMLLGVLMYNGAVRLMPYLIRQMMRLGLWGLRKLWSLLILCKEECAKL